MGFLGFLIGAGVTGHIINKLYKSIEDSSEDCLETDFDEPFSNYIEHHKQIDLEAKQYEKYLSEKKLEEERRQDTPCYFVDGFSESDFEGMVYRAKRKIRRVTNVTVNGPFILGIVESQSGISEWEFILDFNDYGHVTGTFWIFSDNDDSNIPERLGYLIQNEINSFKSQPNV